MKEKFENRNVDYSDLFLKQFRKAPLPIKKAARNRIDLFLKDPFNPLLYNHLLTGKFKEMRSINVTGDWRIIFKEDNDRGLKKVIVFMMIGTHSQLYS